MARHFIGYVSENEILAKDIYKLKIESESLPNSALTGQFVNIKCSDGIDTLLRRPISLMDVDKNQGTFDIAFQVKGIGTKYLSKKRKGDSIDVIGPTGNPFEVNNDYKKIAIIGGGIGIFPLYFLIKSLKNCIVNVFLGFRNKEFVMMEDKFKIYSNNVTISTDDGSYGYSGLIVNYFKETIGDNYDVIYSCGPNPMLKAVSRVAKEHGIKCQVSLEQRMGCGIGACLVCACRIKKGDEWDYKHVCKDGPVFWSDEVIFDE